MIKKRFIGWIPHSMVFFLVILASCARSNKEIPEFNLDLAYDDIKQIIAKANCQSPRGPYQTEVRSYVDGSCYFNQIIEGEPSFPISVSADFVGLVMNENEEVVDTLSKVMVEMIRGHQFHKIHTQPNKLFKNITFTKKLTNGEELFIGMDRFERRVYFFLDPKRQLLTKTEMINPRDTTQTIEVIHKEWLPTEYGPLAKQIEIIQAKTDTFLYDFTKLEVNGITVSKQ